MRDRIVRLAERVLAGERIVLVCWCDPPKACHAAHIRSAVLGVAGQRATRTGK